MNCPTGELNDKYITPYIQVLIVETGASFALIGPQPGLEDAAPGALVRLTILLHCVFLLYLSGSVCEPCVEYAKS